MSSDTKKAACQIGIAVVFLVGLVLAAENLAHGADVPAGTKEAAEVQGPQNVLDLIMAGGYIMIPIGLCSILAMAVAVERFISLTRDKLIPHEFSESLRGSFSGGRKDYVAAMAYCEDTPCPISNIFKAGISRAPQGNEAMEKAIEDAGAREVHKMKRSLKPLSVIARVAPLLGLLGTVYGMIAAFQSASAMGVGKADRLATGIYEALVTTASGLTLAIPVVIVYEILCHRVDSIVDHMDDQAIEFLEYTAYGQDEKRTAEQD